MDILNKHFWKFVGGFLGIVILAIVSLVVFQYWQNYNEEEEMKALLKERRTSVSKEALLR